MKEKDPFVSSLSIGLGLGLGLLIKENPWKKDDGSESETSA